MGLMALKADMEKAYDTMEWEFLLTVLRLLGFCEKWIQIVGQCLSTVSYSILLNRNPFELFRPYRGLQH